MLLSRSLGNITCPKLSIKFTRLQQTVIVCASLSCICIVCIEYVDPGYARQTSFNTRREAKSNVQLRNNDTSSSFVTKTPEVTSFKKRIKLKCNDVAVNLTEFESIPKISDSECSYPYVQGDYRGRLGNQICQYMSLWIFRRQFGARILIANYSYEILQNHFSKLTIPHGNNDCFPFNSSSTVEGSYKLIYDNYLKSIPYFKTNKTNDSPFLKRRNFITGYPCESGLISPYRKELKKELPIKKNVLKEAKVHLSSILAKNGYQRHNITLVSVHVRRTDYMNYTREHDQFLPDQKYFQQLMNNFRERFYNAVFAIFSDDIQWCKDHLYGSDVIFPGKSDIKNPMFDFTLITLCDHHIIGLGTYSITSAFLGTGSIAFGVSEKYIKKTQLRRYLCNKLFTPILIT